MLKIKILTAAITLALPVIACGDSGSKLSSKVESVIQLDRSHKTQLILKSNLNSLSATQINLQNTAINSLKQSYPNLQSRINTQTGILESLFIMALPGVGETPEEIARQFLSQQQNLFPGIDISQLNFDASKSKPAFGGHIVRFEQRVDGIAVLNAGIGLVIDKNKAVRAVVADYQPNIGQVASPIIDANIAIQNARTDLSQFARTIPGQAQAVLQSAYSTIEAQLGAFNVPHPELVIVNDSGSFKKAWQFYLYSQNPFGVFKFIVDSQSGAILSREDQVKTIEEDDPTAQYADYFPTFPPITDNLQDHCVIEDDLGGVSGKPAGMSRIKLRKFDESNRVSGQSGTLTGKHALIANSLPTKLPFAQAAAGSYYFDEDLPPLKARPNEKDHTAEPAEHLDGISQFIYITNLMEYLDYLHKEGDDVHNRGIGEGDFPNTYPNESVPLVGVVHIPNVLEPPEDPTSPNFTQELLGLDNAFAVPLSQEINGEDVVVNPTFYGHGYLFNNLAIDFSVPMHEGTHATITPIAGFEGSPEGGALNEGQADLWAYTIGDTPDLGRYPVNSCDLRHYLAENNVEPDSFQYIRSAQSQLRYSQLGTRDNGFEVHRDGEIYAGAMWDLRQLMLEMYPWDNFVRPNPVTGESTKQISTGKETWERTFLGSMYVLGLSAPDTFVKARDAALIANALLYPSNPMDLNSRGHHHALIERVFAARELGINSQAPIGGRQMISTAVSQFTANQAAPTAPQSVKADVIDAKTVNVSWQPVDGAIAYQVLKRKGGSPQRLFSGVENREYFEGDAQHLGYTHVEFVTNQTNYYDKGQGYGRSEGQGIDAFDYQYVIRAIGVNTKGAVGFSNLSATTKIGVKSTNVSHYINYKMSNVSFDGNRFNFDQSLINSGTDEIYGPLQFVITQISDSSITVANADNGGSGTATDPAVFIYDTSLAPSDESLTRALSFNNPHAKMFTFKAKVIGLEAVDRKPVNGSQRPFDTSEPVEREPTFHYLEQKDGLVIIGTTDQLLIDGVDYVDVHFKAKNSAKSVIATLSADPEIGGAYPDLDLKLLDSNGHEMASSGNLGANEQVGGGLAPGQTYTLRIIGWANGPTQYHLVIDQLVSDKNDAQDIESTNEASAEEVEFQLDPNSTVISSIMI
jgi:hypothetical protein